ncbi:MAG: hypothetical protein MRJ92_09455 [Nitrospira sp.]|nr:hypothetical protein [Nitrospira sp.]
MTHAARIGQGVSTMAAGLTKLVVPVDHNGPEVHAIRNNIAESAQYKAQFQGLMDSLDKLGTQKAQLMEGVERAQHTLSESCATISKSLLQSAAIGRQMQTMGNALDLEVKLYARALRQRSEERLRKSLYHVVKSYEYHTLSRVPQDFFRTSVIEKIKKLENEKLESGQPDQTLTEDDFSKIYETVFKDKFSQLGEKITDTLQRVKPSMDNQYLCTLKPAQLTQLTDTWQLKFRLVEDFGKTSGNPESAVGARIIGIVLKTLDIATADNGLSLDIEFRHSGKHIITDQAGFQYFFQIGKYPIEAQDGSKIKKWVSDQPISWRMVYNAAAGSEQITLDKQATEDQIVRHLLREYKPGTEGDAKTLQEHRPGFTSEITLTLDGGLDLTKEQDVKKKARNLSRSGHSNSGSFSSGNNYDSTHHADGSWHIGAPALIRVRASSRRACRTGCQAALHRTILFIRSRKRHVTKPAWRWHGELDRRSGFKDLRRLIQWDLDLFRETHRQREARRVAVHQMRRPGTRTSHHCWHSRPGCAQTCTARSRGDGDRRGHRFRAAGEHHMRIAGDPNRRIRQATIYREDLYREGHPDRQGHHSPGLNGQLDRRARLQEFWRLIPGHVLVADGVKR